MLFLALAVATGFLACSKFDDFDGIQNPGTDAEFAIPLAKANFSLDDLLEDLTGETHLFIDPDGTLRLNYKGDLAVKTSTDVFASIQKTLTDIPIVPVTDTFMTLPFSAPDSILIDSMLLKKGYIVLQIINTVLDVINLEWEFVDARKDGKTLSGQRLMVPFQNVTDTVSLVNYALIPSNDSIHFRYKATRASTGERIKLDLFGISFRDIEFSYLEGYFGQFVHEGTPDTIEIEFFESWTRGDVYFEDPTITIYTSNSFGIPTRSIIHYFDVKTVKQDVLSLQSPYVTNGVNFAFPRLPFEVGQTKIDTFTFNRRNSNIDVILGAGPEFVYYDVDAQANPDRDFDLRGFVTDSSAYRVQVEVDLPFYGKSSGFAVRDTFDWNFDGYDDVKDAEFKIVSENGMGLEVQIQGYFVDANNVVVDSLFDKSRAILEAAPVDANGNVISRKRAENFASFTADRFARLKSAKKILLNAAFFTADQGKTSVRVRRDQDVQLRMGMRFKT